MTIRTINKRLEVTLTKEEYVAYLEYCNEPMFAEYKYDIDEAKNLPYDTITINEDMLSTYDREEENPNGFCMYEDDFYYLLKYAFDANGTQCMITF